MSRRVVATPRLVGVHLTHCAMTGVGLLCYEVWMVSHDLRNIVTQVRFGADLSSKSGSRFVFYVVIAGRITKTEKLCYLCTKERFHRNRNILSKG